MILNTNAVAIRTSEESSMEKSFAYGSKPVRTLEINGEVWFVAKDVCNVLGIVNDRDAIQSLDDDETITIKRGKGLSWLSWGGTVISELSSTISGTVINNTSELSSNAINPLDDKEKMTQHFTDSHSGQRGGAQFLNLVSESGLYKLIYRSRKPEAKKFTRWVTHEVLPAIRTSGSYLSQKDKEELERLKGKWELLIDEVYRLRSENQALLRQVDQLSYLSECAYKEFVANHPATPRPIKQFLARSQLLTIERLAWVLQAGNSSDAPVINRNSLFVWLRQYGYLSVESDSWNQPTEESLKNNWFVVQNITLESTKQVYSQTLCTPAGLDHFLALQAKQCETFTPLTDEEIRQLIE